MKKNKNADWTSYISDDNTDDISFDTDLFVDLEDSHSFGDISFLPDASHASLDIPPDFVEDFFAPDDDISFDTDCVYDLSDVIGGEPDTKVGSLVDLNWLDPGNVVEDPLRLPNNKKTLNVVPSLEKAWGRTSKTVFPTERKTVQNTTKTAQEKAKELKDSVSHAMRRSHFGDNLSSIVKELAVRVGKDHPVFASVVEKLKDDHGLAGKVFIRASAFPGLKEGKWDKQLTKMSSAKYVITNDQSLATKLGLRMADKSVVWKSAYLLYRPMFKAAGIRVETTSDHKEALRLAFREMKNHSVEATPIVPTYDLDVTSSSKMSDYEKARTDRLKYIEAKKAKAHAEEMNFANSIVQKAVRSGFLSKETADGLIATNNPKYITARVDEINNSRHNAVFRSYDDVGVGMFMTNGGVVGTVASKSDLVAREWSKANAYLDNAVVTGRITSAERTSILAKCKTPKTVLDVTTSLIQKKAATKSSSERAKSTVVAEYGGHVQTEHRGSVTAKYDNIDVLTTTASKLASTSNGTVKTREIVSLYKWIKTAMSEGSAGKSLDTLMNVRWSSAILKVAKPLIDEVRTQHEGALGSLYVDAATYASANGVSGCEDGGLKHRANTIKYLVQMDRCGSCVHNKMGSCGVYRKELIASANEFEGLESFKKKALKRANMDPSEALASMLSPSNNVVAEYQLGYKNSLSNIDLGDVVNVDEFGDITFDGMVIE